ncbi:hypothetical protein AK821_10490 [Pseudomonas sp. RIT-PI-r]|nr:hypothetical protein AK821_10490 [Pseudomonas sp. RIT-PI-r]
MQVITPSLHRFLVAALCGPMVLLVVLTIVDWFAGYSQVSNWKQFLMIYVLGFGIPAYFVFATWATRALSKVTEQEILKKVLWAPLMFIPFYATPWIIGGLVLLLLGELSGLPMMFAWLAFLPYLLVAGYFVSGLTVALYRIFF